MKNTFSVLILLLLLTNSVKGQLSSRQAEKMVINNDIKSISELLANGQNINETFQSNMTFLNMATRYGKFNLVKFLVEKGADLNIQDNDLHSPLLISTSWAWRNDSISEYLINKGADLNVHGMYGSTALRNTIGILDQRQRNIKIFNLLIEKGADINYKCIKCNNSTIFLYCCAYGTKEILQLLIDKKIDINQCNSNGLNGLMYAINANNTDNIKLLIQNGIDLNHQDKNKRTATAYAVQTRCDIIPDGTSVYYGKKGHLLSETPYKNGEQHGLYKFYYTNGKTRQSIEYVDGVQCGFWREYYKNGQLKKETEYDGEDGIVNDIYYSWNTKGEKFTHKGVWIERGRKVGRIQSSYCRLKYVKTKVN